MPSYDGGSAAIKVRPSFRGFVRETEDELKRYNFSLDVQIGADTRVAAAEIANLQRAARESQTFHMGADTRVAAGEIAELQRIARANQSFRADVDTSVAAAKLAALKQMGGSIPFNAEMSGTAAANARSGLTKLTRGLRSAATINISVGAVLGAGAAMAQLTQLAAAAARVGQVSALAPASGFAALAGGAGLATGLSGIGGAFKAMSAATEDATSSASSHTSALADVASAQYAVQASNRGLSDAYKTAGRSIRDVNQDLADQELTARGAALSVEEAQKRLTAVRFDPTADSTTRKRAQLELEQAIANQTKQRNNLQDLGEDAAEANRKGIEGSDQVVAARQAQTQAVEQLRRATESLNQGSSSQANLDKALAKLSPQARKAVEDVRSLGPAWTDVRKSAQDALTEGMGGSIKTLADQQLPNLRDGLSGINSAFNRGFRDMLGSLSSERNKLDFRTSLENTRSGFSNAAKAAGPFTDALTKLTTVGTTFLPQFGDGIGRAADKFNGLIQQSASDGSLRKWMQDGVTATRELFSILGNVGSSVASIFRASGAGDTLASIDRVTEGWRRFLKSTTGQDTLREWFSEAREGADRVGQVLEDLPGILRGVWEGFQTWAAIAGPFLKVVTSVLSAQPELVTAAVAAFIGYKTLAPIFGGVRSGIERTSGALSNLQGRATGTLGALRGIATATGGVANVAGVGATNLGRFGSAVQQAGTHVPAIARMQQSFMDSATAAQRFGRMSGAAAAGMSGLRSAASGVSGVLGGPWGIAMLAAIGSAIAISREVRKAGEQQDILTSSSQALAISQREVATAFRGTAGALTETTLSKLSAQIDNVSRDAQRLADTAPGAFSVFTGGGRDIAGWFRGQAQAGTDAVKAQEAVAEAGKNTKASLDEVGLSSDEMAAKLSGSDSEFAAFIVQLQNTSNGGKEAVGKMRELREAFQRSQATARDTTPGFFALNDAVKVLTNTSSSAADKLNAMKTALDVLSGKPVDAQKALADYNDQVRSTEEFAKNFDKEGGVGEGLVKDGQVDTATANGRRLFDILLGIKEETLKVAIAGGDLDAALAENSRQFAILGGATQLGQDGIAKLAKSIGLVPRNVELLAELKGATDVQGELVAIGKMIQNSNGEPVRIPMELLSAPARAELEKWKVDVGTATDNPNIATIDANTAPAQAAVDTFINNPKTLKINVELDKFRNVKIVGATATLTGNATGGQLPTTGPGTEKRDGILGMSAATGAPMTWLDGGEWIINRDSSEKYGPILKAINAGSFPRMADGGVVGGGSSVDALLNYARSVDGTPYGGVYDCSGLISQLANVASGMDPFAGRMGTATEGSWLAAHGWTSGAGGPGTFSVGWINDPQMAAGGHTAGTLPNGTNVESSGDEGVIYGGNAIGHLHPMFNQWAHLVMDAASSSALSDLKGAATGGGFSGGLLPDGSAAPQAALPGRRSDSELQRLSNEAAVDTANAERNSVYANPQSTDQDRLAADLAYQRAQNSLESSSGSDDVPTLPGFLGKAGTILGNGILSAFGLEKSVLSPSSEYAGAIQKGYNWATRGQGASNFGAYSYVPKGLSSQATTSTPQATTGAPIGNPVEEWRRLAMQRAQGFARGGFVRGTGGSQGDGIMARLSPGEFIVNAAATAVHRPWLEDINANTGKKGRAGASGGFGEALVSSLVGQDRPTQGADIAAALGGIWAGGLNTPEAAAALAGGPGMPGAPGARGAAGGMGQAGASYDLSTHIHNPQLADLNHLVDLVERRAHARSVGMMAAFPK